MLNNSIVKIKTVNSIFENAQKKSKNKYMIEKSIRFHKM